MSNIGINKFGEKLFQLRVQHHLTLQMLANELGYKAHGYISEIESGKKTPTLEFVLKVAQYFHISLDHLLRNELEIHSNERKVSEGKDMALSLVHQFPSPHEIERLRLTLSTFQDGTGQLIQPDGTTLPGWRDFERAVGLTFQGVVQESKAIFDVLLWDSVNTNMAYGISCKMRGTLNDTNRTGRVTIELSNSAGKFWQALAQLHINQENYKAYPEQVGQTLVALIQSWHQAVSLEHGGHIDLSKSSYLTLSWNKSGQYQLHQFPLMLPHENIRWVFPEGEARLVGYDEYGKLYEWYGESGGQLKYYPLIGSSLWHSPVFILEPLPSTENPYGLLTKVKSYFPELWAKTDPQ